jgi:hypothetical protein
MGLRRLLEVANPTGPRAGLFVPELTGALVASLREWGSSSTWTT